MADTIFLLSIYLMLVASSPPNCMTAQFCLSLSRCVWVCHTLSVICFPLGFTFEEREKKGHGAHATERKIGSESISVATANIAINNNEPKNSNRTKWLKRYERKAKKNEWQKKWHALPHGRSRTNVKEMNSARKKYTINSSWYTFSKCWRRFTRFCLLARSFTHTHARIFTHIFALTMCHSCFFSTPFHRLSIHFIRFSILIQRNRFYARTEAVMHTI